MKHLGLLLVLASLGTAEAGNDKNPNCEVFTLDELKTVLGKTVVQGFEMEHMCVYQLAPAETTMTDQMMITVSVMRDQFSEDEVKRQNGDIGKQLKKPMTPSEIHGVGDWAFITTVSKGASVRGRMLQTHKGPWHLMVSVALSPDPGEAKLDAEMVTLAKTGLAKLKK